MALICHTPHLCAIFLTNIFILCPCVLWFCHEIWPTNVWQSHLLTTEWQWLVELVTLSHNQSITKFMGLSVVPIDYGSNTGHSFNLCLLPWMSQRQVARLLLTIKWNWWGFLKISFSPESNFWYRSTAEAKSSTFWSYRLNKYIRSVFRKSMICHFISISTWFIFAPSTKTFFIFAWTDSMFDPDNFNWSIEISSNDLWNCI